MKKNTVLVMTIGGSSGPLVKSLKEHDPGCIYYIPSGDTEDKIPEIRQAAFSSNHHAVEKTFVINDPSNLPECYRKCREVFADIHKYGLEDKTIIADPTGGTKVMSAALLLAAIGFGVRVSYVSGDARTKGGTGVVVDGREKVVYNDHPFDLIAKPQKEKFCEFFNSYRFSPAVDVCNEIIEKGSKRLKDIFKVLRDITVVYRDWDLFKYKNIGHNLDSCLDRLRSLYTDYPSDIEKLSAFIGQVAGNAAYLKRLEAGNISLPMVEELVANAVRRAEEGRYDDAVARLYRALEMVAQAQFMEKYGRSTSKFPFTGLHDKLKPAYQHRKNKDEVVDLGCRDAFKQLYYAGMELGRRYMENEEEIKGILNQRNNSILAHGITPLNRAKYEKLYSIFSGVFGLDGKSVKFAKIGAGELEAIGIERENP